MEKRKLEERDVALYIILTIITFGLFGIYWLVVTKRDIKSRGGDVPTCWLLIIPIANIYLFYKYSRAAEKVLKKDGDWIVYFIFCFIFNSVITLALVQDGLNHIVRKEKKGIRAALKKAVPKRKK
jgi:hypothetical protein